MSKKIISFTLLSASLLFHSTMLEAMMRLRCLLKTPRALGKAVLRPIKSPASVRLLSHFPLKNQQNRNFSSKSLPGNNNSLLIESIQAGSKEKLYELIKKGLVDINARYDNNDTILHIAAKSDLSPEIIEVLIKAGADVNAQNDLGYTPLHLAVKYERAEMVKLLVANGANPNALDTKGIWGKIVPGSLFRLFAQGKSPLYFAQEKDNPSSETLEIIKFLEPLTHKSLWFVVTPEVALRRAILLNRLEKIKLLLSEQVFSKQALDAALLEGASHYETTAEVLALIIDAGADVNTKNSLQRTPLHYAARYGNVATVKLLLKKGANPNISDRNGETPLDLAKKRLFPSKEIIEILEQCTVKPKKIAGEEIRLSLTGAIESCQLANVQQVLAQGTFSKKELNDALLDAAKGSFAVRTKMVAALLDAGADINTQDRILKRTPLHNAAHYHNPSVVELLLRRGANPNALDCQGKSPLYFAQEEDLPSQETLAIIRLLEPVTDKSLWFVVTPEIMLARAVKGNNTEEVRSLLEYAEEFEAEESTRKQDLPTQQPTKKFSIGSQKELLKAWKMVFDRKTAYEILGLDKKSSEQEKKAIYLNWVRNHHPDRYLDNELNQKATIVLKYLNGKLN